MQMAAINNHLTFKSIVVSLTLCFHLYIKDKNTNGEKGRTERKKKL